MSNSDSFLAEVEAEPTTPPDTFHSEVKEELHDPDPLLGSGSFIDPNNNRGEEEGGGYQIVSNNDNNNYNNNDMFTTPGPLVERNSDTSNPSWLPQGWSMVSRRRTSGASQGAVDRYYIGPSGQRLRSKNEVLNFLETGSKQRRKKPLTLETGSKRKKPPTQNSDGTHDNSITCGALITGLSNRLGLLTDETVTNQSQTYYPKTVSKSSCVQMDIGDIGFLVDEQLQWTVDKGRTWQQPIEGNMVDDEKHPGLQVPQQPPPLPAAVPVPRTSTRPVSLSDEYMREMLHLQREQHAHTTWMTGFLHRWGQDRNFHYAQPPAIVPYVPLDPPAQEHDADQEQDMYADLGQI